MTCRRCRSPLTSIPQMPAPSPMCCRCGLSRAAAIVAYREEHGAFKQVDELGKVKGVGNRTLELNATRILLKD